MILLLTERLPELTAPADFKRFQAKSPSCEALARGTATRLRRFTKREGRASRPVPARPGTVTLGL